MIRGPACIQLNRPLDFFAALSVRIHVYCYVRFGVRIQPLTQA
jgi:hypothetical protein